MRDLACPDDGELRSYLLGRLPEAAEETIQQHLAICPSCEATAAQLDELTDPLIDELRDLSLTAPSNASSTFLNGMKVGISTAAWFKTCRFWVT